MENVMGTFPCEITYALFTADKFKRLADQYLIDRGVMSDVPLR
jgi:hypothetical protein